MGKEAGRNYVDIMSTHSDVTGSCLFGVAKLSDYSETKKFAIDCGLFQGKDQEENNGKLLFNPDRLNFVGVTHAHVDHVGQLPLLYKNGAKCNMYSAKGTAELLPYQLGDCLRIGEDTAKRKHEKPLYGQIDVDNALKARKGCEYGETIKVNDWLRMTFFQNGHLYGASMILVQITAPGGGINILFTGDYSAHNMFFPVEKLPKWVKKLPLTVVIEATYGTMTTEDMHPCFEDNLIDAINNKKDIVIPAFSLGRGQEVMLVLRDMQRNGRLSTDIPILYCGKLGIRYTNNVFYDNPTFYPEVQKFYPEGIRFMYDTSEILTFPGRKIILGSAGMGGYGPMQTLIPEFIRRNALIHFTGYCAEGTLGRRLMDAQKDKSLEVSGRLVKKHADVKFTTEFSAHAKSDELIAFLQQFENLQAVLVNHGSYESKRAFAEKVLEEVETKDVAILSRDLGFRINQFGIQKSLNTKFV